MKHFLAIFLLFIFAGCSSKVPIATKYKINASVQSNEYDNSEKKQCLAHSLKVMQSFSSGMLMSSDMYYIIDDNKLYPYSESKWAISPNRTVSQKLYETLRDLNLFKTVQNSKSRTITSWILESQVEDFMQYYENDNKNSFVKVSINMTVFQNKTSKVIASKVFKSKVQTQTKDAQGGVKALDIALKEILTQTSQWLVEECQ